MSNDKRSYLEGNLNSNHQNSLSSNIVYIDFPRKYERKFVDSFDRRFAAIWLVTFIFHVVAVYYFSTHELVQQVQHSEIIRIQQQYARLIFEDEHAKQSQLSQSDFAQQTTFKDKQSRKQEHVSDKSRVSSSKEATTTRQEDRQFSKTTVTGREAGSGYPSQITAQAGETVRSKGLLGLLSSSSTRATGEQVDDLLGDAAASQQNLKQALGSVNQINQEPGKDNANIVADQNRKLRGDRVSTTTEIDGLITDREKAASTQIDRKKDYVREQSSTTQPQQAVVSGRRDPDEISAVVNRHNATIQACYQRELRRNPNLKGKLVVRFTISPAGTVKDVQLISSTLNNSKVDRCIISRIRRWDDFGEIDPSMGDTSFRQVYTFGY
ncbi:MAG: AgmX/PglI C-terminal domain-containing protein [bacterium]|nr:AgmX/PglI C-terminal domain-containing protein [bacterium]